MALNIEFDPDALKDLSRLDEQIQRRIFKYFRERIAPSNDPRRFGKPLMADKKGLWRYRIGAYRVICAIYDGEKRVVVYRVGHRRNVYD